MIPIEVAYANPQNQTVLTIEVSENAKIQEAIYQSGILAIFPEIDLTQNQVGIWGEVKSLFSKLSAHDRIEIYRPLLIDPKKARLLRS